VTVQNAHTSGSRMFLMSNVHSLAPLVGHE